MIQHAFTSAYTNEVGSQMKTFNTQLSGIKDIAVLAAGVLGFSGGLGTGAVAKGAEHALAGRVGGIGGNIMLATLQQKAETAKAKQEIKNLFTAEEVGQTIESQLGDNPINRAAKKSLGTVFETLVNAREQEIINKKGNIESSIGEIDPNSELGKKILSQLEEKKTDNVRTKNISVKEPTLTINEEEAEEIINKPIGYFNESDTENIESKVKNRMGTTYSWSETGYITPDGARIDLSGKNEGAPGGSRSIDHRDIFEEEDVTGDFDRTQNMIEFMKRGNIRVNPEYPGINLSTKEPTKEQYDLIQNMAERLGWKQGYFAVDLDDEKGNTIGSLTYEAPISSRTIIADIKEYFKTGKMPRQEDNE